MFRYLGIERCWHFDSRPKCSGTVIENYSTFSGSCSGALYLVWQNCKLSDIVEDILSSCEQLCQGKYCKEIKWENDYIWAKVGRCIWIVCVNLSLKETMELVGEIVKKQSSVRRHFYYPNPHQTKEKYNKAFNSIKTNQTQFWPIKYF